MTAPPPSEWLEQGQNAMWFFGLAFMGMMVFIFGRPIQHPPRKKTPRNGRKQKRKQAKAAKPKQKQKKAKPEKPKPWYVAPPMSPHEHAEYAKYYAKSRGIKASETGEWSIPD